MEKALQYQNRWLPGIVVSGLTVCAGQTAQAVSLDKELLGIHILQSYRAVQARYGEPTRIYRVGIPIPLSVSPTGSVTGITDLNDSVRPTDTAMAVNIEAGIPAAVPADAAGSAPSGGRGGISGGAGSNNADITSEEYFTNLAKDIQKRLNDALSAGGAALTSTQVAQQQQLTGGEQTFRQSGGYIFLYHSVNEGVVRGFVFNAQGRVEMIFARGSGASSGGTRIVTQHGIGLGSPLQSVYQQYHWPDKTEREGSVFRFRYNQKYHSQIDIMNNRVIGIAVFLRETQGIDLGSPTGGDSANGGASTASSGGRGGVSGPGRGGFGGGLPGFRGGDGG